MKTPEQLIRDSKKIVIKLGSNTISDETGKVNREIMKAITAQVMQLINSGKRVVIVSSEFVQNGYFSCFQISDCTIRFFRNSNVERDIFSIA